MSAPLPLQNDRFVFEARLGTGASGTVYRAYDQERDARVAVKLLNQLDAVSVYRFKREFRALTGIAHPNLLQLYDLVLRDDQWLLTMELVEGDNLLRWVRPASVPSQPLSNANTFPDSDSEPTLDSDAAEAHAQNWKSLHSESLSQRSDGALDTQDLSHEEPGARAQLGVLDEARLRKALRQLAEGLHALHAENRLHRDLKPANVLVFARDERVVICDFGLVADLSREGESEDGPRRSVAGTLSYMSPEQARGQPLTPAADWYAVGVMLYQALTGVLPVSPRLSYARAVLAKQQGAAVHPCSFAPEAPRDLADLALSLLNPRAEQRPSYREVLARLDGTAKPPSLAPSGPSLLVGRTSQLNALQAAFQRAWAGRTTVATVCGRSGMGKSALVQQFLDEMRLRHGAVVLSGRCYEREELPYKAFDPLIDALGAYLLQLGESETRALLPPQVGALARLFPALKRVPSIAERAGVGEAADRIEQRRRAFSAFRELCRRIAEDRPLVLCIDDLQWGDLESVPLFAELLRAPDAPSLLLVGMYRAEDHERSPLLTELRKTQFPALGLAPVEIVVDALEPRDARALAASLLEDLPDAAQAATRVAAEAGGSPLFVRELAQYVRAHEGSAAELSLENVIAQRLADLSRDSRTLFDLIAVAGRPEKRSLLQRAAGLGEQSFGALRVLETTNLVHSVDRDADGKLEAAHDRLRETAYRLLAKDERERLHSVLAAALEQSEPRDAEALLDHYRRAGQQAAAGRVALEAAHNAEAQLAFARAAELFRTALALSELGEQEARTAEERLGQCLALAGRGIEAAAAFSRAAVGASPAQSMTLRSLATTELLRAGSVAAAYEELRRARELTGVTFPPNNFSALAMLLWRRFKIWLKRRALRSLEERPIDSTLLQRADMLWGIGATLVSMDTLRGAVYQAEHLLVALRAGEPYRLARAMAVEGTLAATRNTNASATRYYFDRGLELGGLSCEPHAMTVVKGTHGCACLLEGRWHECIRLCREAALIVRERINATLSWELNTLVFFDLQASAWIGNVHEIVERVPAEMRDAEARGDLYALTSCRSYRNVWAWLGVDQLEEARRQVQIAERAWPREGYHLQHWYTTFAFAEVELYAGDSEDTLARIDAELPALFFLRQIQYTRIEVWFTRARLRLARARRCHERDLVNDAREDAAAIAAERVTWGSALARLIQACAASFDDLPLARKLLRELEGLFDAIDMLLLKEVVRYRRGQLEGDDAGALRVRQASDAIRALGVARPDRYVAMLAPGFPSV